jgi:two-component system, OmpR family, sensor kinase
MEPIEHGRGDRSLIDAVLTHLARIDRTRAELRQARTTRRVALNLAAMTAIALAVVAVHVRVGSPAGDGASATVFLMAGLAASAGGAAALMMVFAARLAGNPWVTWAGMAFGWYCLLAIPISTAWGLDGRGVVVATAANVLIHAAAAVLWLIVLLAPEPASPLRLLRRLAVGAALLVVTATIWGTLAPEGVRSIGEARTLWLAYALVWLVVALVTIARATVSRSPALGTIGVGLVLLGAAQVGDSVVAPAAIGTSPLFASLRLAAVAIVLWGGLRLSRRALVLLDGEQALHEVELRRAEVRLARAAARDHDLRNGLAGLAGATAVLGGGAATGKHLSRVVAGELRRLEVLLEGQNGDDDGCEAVRSYAVAPALDGLVMLRRSAGMDVRADVEPGLHATGSPRTLAQVLTNLLANAERHAPGSPVRITALGRADRVEIRVRDFGPGITPGRELAVLEPGVRNARGGGLGLGLHLCRTLLTAEDAVIEVVPADASAPGCVVLLVLPAGEEGDPERPGTDRGDVRAAS